MKKIFSYFRKRTNTTPSESKPCDFVNVEPVAFVPNFDFPSFKDGVPEAVAYQTTIEDDGAYQMHVKYYKNAPKYRTYRELSKKEYKEASRELEAQNKQSEFTARMVVKCKKLEEKFNAELADFEDYIEGLRIASLKRVVAYMRKMKKDDPELHTRRDMIIANERERLATRLDFERRKFERIADDYKQKINGYWSYIEDSLDMCEGPVVYDAEISTICEECIRNYDKECTQYYSEYTEYNGAVVKYVGDMEQRCEVYPGQSVNFVSYPDGVQYGTSGFGRNTYVKDLDGNTILITVNQPPKK